MESIKQYIEWKASYTIRAGISYEIWLKKFLTVTKKDVYTAKLSDIMKFRKWLEMHYNPASMQLAMVILSNYFKFYRLQGVKCVDPRLIRFPRVNANSYQSASFEDYVKILSVIRPVDFKSFQDLMIMRMLWDTGVRVSELVSMDVAQIHPNKTYATITTSKSHNIRQVFWSRETDIFLKEYVKERKKLNNTPALFVGLSYNGTVSRRISTRSIQRMIQRLCKEAKIEKKLNPHSFRHGKAHRILDLGGNPKDVQAILGHTNPNSSFTYLQWNDQEFERRAKMFL